MFKSDILIIGTGIAGLSTAIQLALKRSDLSISVVSKTNKEESNTRYAQGGIAAVWDRIKDDFEKPAGRGSDRQLPTQSIIQPHLPDRDPRNLAPSGNILRARRHT